MNRDSKEIFESLKGEWAFERKIYNVTTKTTVLASGNASFTLISEAPNCLDYVEIGLITLQENLRNINFSKKYIYKLFEDQIEIVLNDGVTKGELFQVLLPSEEENLFHGTEHICRLDTHNGRYYFKDNSSFKTEFSVIGPNTNMKITSVYTRHKMNLN
ncbi:DUF6314 family protein [Aureivirga marina]|uniref:DUF6314 family protein n=1 Tax=Aureivirga marina TaxID=1182451 RepID=UPI0018CB39C1|nr:DUF6314 family protein [Aureivirga marina]